jgi:hypothetical protein
LYGPLNERAFRPATLQARLDVPASAEIDTALDGLLALKWADIDLDHASLRVRATLQKTPAGFTFAEPKTSRSRR